MMKPKFYKKENVLFIASLGQCIYVLFIYGIHLQEINIYKYRLSGAIYEMITLPILVSTIVVLPLYCFLWWKKGKAFYKVKNLIGLLINVGTIAFLTSSFII